MVASSNPDGSSAPDQVLAGMVELQRKILGDKLDLSSALNTIAERACSFTHASGAAIGLLEGGKLIYHAAVGNLSDGPANIDESRAIARQCLRTGRILQCNDLLRMESSLELRRIQRLGVRSLLGVPVMHRRVAIGSLEVVSCVVHAFNQEHVRILQLISRLVCFLVNRNREKELQAQVRSERTAMQDGLATLTTLYEHLSTVNAMQRESGCDPEVVASLEAVEAALIQFKSIVNASEVLISPHSAPEQSVPNGSAITSPDEDTSEYFANPERSKQISTRDTGSLQAKLGAFVLRQSGGLLETCGSDSDTKDNDRADEAKISDRIPGIKPDAER